MEFSKGILRKHLAMALEDPGFQILGRWEGELAQLLFAELSGTHGILALAVA